MSIYILVNMPGKPKDNTRNKLRTHGVLILKTHRVLTLETHRVLTLGTHRVLTLETHRVLTITISSINITYITETHGDLYKEQPL